MTATAAALKAEARVLRPQKGPQEAFLSTKADVAIYGGSAGGGKSFALLLEPLRHVGNRQFTAVLFRRTTPQLRNPGGLWDESMGMYPLLNGRPREFNLEWTFPTGCKIVMRHLEHDSDVMQHQGTAYCYIGFDELTHFSRHQFFYMMSRNRSTSGIRPYIRATTNPDADSWVAEWISWYIDQESGYAIPERAGVVRYFFIMNDIVYWGDTKDEIREQLPYTEVTDDLIKSFTFIPARLEDNPALMTKDPGYKASLFAQSEVDRERLYGGNWKIKPAAGNIFNREWFSIVDRELLPQGGSIVRFWDLAATEKQLKGPKPDWTAGVMMLKASDGYFYILDMIAVQRGPTEVDALITRTAAEDTLVSRSLGARYRVRWEKQPAAAGIAWNLAMVRMLAGYDCMGVEPVGDKFMRAKGLAAQAAVRFVRLVRGSWNETWLAHMHAQPDIPKKDIMDASSGSFNELVFPEGPKNAGILLHGKTAGW